MFRRPIVSQIKSCGLCSSVPMGAGGSDVGATISRWFITHDYACREMLVSCQNANPAVRFAAHIYCGMLMMELTESQQALHPIIRFRQRAG